MAGAKYWGGRDIMNEDGNGVVKVLRSRGFGQIEKAEVKLDGFTIWWEVRLGTHDLTDEQVEGIVEEFRQSIERRRKTDDEDLSDD